MIGHAALFLGLGARRLAIIGAGRGAGRRASSSTPRSMRR